MTMITTTAELAAAVQAPGPFRLGHGRHRVHARNDLLAKALRDPDGEPGRGRHRRRPGARDLDLDPFFKLMGNEKVIKVFHAARQDIEIVYHRGGLIPHPVFDTQVAAMVCGFGDSVSYDQLVQRLTGARLDKSSRFTDWSRRPLSERQIEYALADVTHLRDVYQALSARLDEQNRTDWVREEMEVLTSPATYQLEPEDAWKRLKMRIRKPRRTRHPAAARRLARARGPGPRRAARARHQGRRDLRDRPAAADDRRPRSASSARCRAASSARAPPKRSSPRSAAPSTRPRTSCRGLPKHRPAEQRQRRRRRPPEGAPEDDQRGPRRRRRR